MILNNSSTKKVILREHFKCSLYLKTILSKCFVIFYNEILTVPMKSATELRSSPINSCVSLVKESVALNDSKSQ